MRANTFEFTVHASTAKGVEEAAAEVVFRFFDGDLDRIKRSSCLYSTTKETDAVTDGVVVYDTTEYFTSEVTVSYY